MEIAPMIMEGIALTENDKKRQIGVYYPSELPYCMRKVYYAYIDEQKHDLETLKNFAVGSAYHSVVQKALTFYAKAHPEIKLVNEAEGIEWRYSERDIELHGRPDVVIVTPDGKTHIVEIKSIATLRRLYGEAQEHHIAQINFYLHARQDGDGHVLYMNKEKRGNGIYEEFKEYQVNYSEPEFRKLVERAFTLQDFLVSNYDVEMQMKETEDIIERDVLADSIEIPLPEAYLRGGTMDGECRFMCRYRTKCFTNIIEKIAGREEYRKFGDGVYGQGKS